MAEICVDASFVLKLVLPEVDSTRVRTRWASWLSSGVTVLAPWLWLFETHSVLRRKVVRRELIDAEAQEAWRVLQRQEIRTVHPPGLFERAWLLAANLGRPTTYDAIYMAVADLRGCELWTADLRLVNAVNGKFNRIHAV